MPKNLRAKCDAASFILAGEIRNRTNTQKTNKQKTVNDISTPPQVDSTFCPPWYGKMSTSQRAVMLCGWGVKAGMV